MPSTQNQYPKHIDHPVDTKLKLAGLWTSTTLCYLYCDYLTLYAPGKLAGMLQGQMGPMGTVTPGALLGTSVLLVIPCTMVVFSLVAPLAWNRWVNVIAGGPLHRHPGPSGSAGEALLPALGVPGDAPDIGHRGLCPALAQGGTSCGSKLGVVPHGTMSFLPGPVFWIVADVSLSQALSVTFYVIHKVRITTFFLRRSLAGSDPGLTDWSALGLL